MDERALPAAVSAELADLLLREARPSREAIEELVAKCPEHAGLIRSRARAAGVPHLILDSTEEKVGPYRLLRELGTGGHGRVYLAERDADRGQVAVKVLKKGMDSEELLARFRQESRILAAMQHPGIAAIHDSGFDGDGRAYFAMEYVDGQPIQAFCEARGLGPRGRVHLMVEVARAVAHAHQRGVIHRDLKPANVLVTEIDGAPRAKVIDFGIARSLQGDLHTGLVHTGHGVRVGTLPYMAPEQLAPHLYLEPGESPDVRADVYGLGAVLYELLAGRAPFSVDETADEAELERRVLEEDPPAPGTLAGRDGARSDLDCIVSRALAKDPNERYASAVELRQDLERFLAHEPVTARPPSRAYRARKFVRRHRGAVMSSAVVLGVLVLGLVGTAAGFLGKAAALAAERERTAELGRVADFYSEVFEGIDPERVGGRLRRRILGALEGEEPSVADSELAAVDAALARVDLTAVGVAVVGEAVLGPAERALDVSFGDVPRLRAMLRMNIAKRYRGLGLLQDAERVTRQVIEARLARLGPESPETLNAMYTLQQVRHERGDSVGVVEELRRILAVQRRVCAESGGDLPQTLSYLGGVLRGRGELEEARRLTVEAYETRLARFGESDEATLEVLNDLGVLYQSMGELDEAERCLRECLSVRQERRPHERLTYESMNNYGRLLRRRGRYAKAAELFERALSGKRAVIGGQHPSTLRTLLGLGVCHFEWYPSDPTGNHLELARGYADECLQGREAELGASHPDTQRARGLVASVAFYDGDLESATEQFEELHRWQREHLPEESNDFLRTLFSLGACYKEQREYALAEKHLAQVERIGLKWKGASRRVLEACEKELRFVREALERDEENR